MTPQEIIREAQRLPVNARREIIDTLSQTLEKSKKKKPLSESEIAQRLLAKGTIKAIPPNWDKVEEVEEPIEIKGRPLSETILEDRN